jgi:hypothetical protein
LGVLTWAGLGSGSAGEPRETATSWDFVVTISDLARGLAEVTWTVRGFGPARPLRVCADMDEAERFVRSIVRLEGSPQANRAPTSKPLPRDGACWRVPGADPRGVVLRYTYDLRDLAAHHGSPDYAQRIGDTYIFNDETLLLRPDPLPRDDGAPEPRIRIELQLPPGVQVATPWQRLPGPGQHYAQTAAQFDRGSYVTIGTIEDLGELKLPHTTVQIVTLPANRRMSADALRNWVNQAMTAIDGFYGPLTPPRILVNLIPVPGSTHSGLFGSVLRPLYPSAIIYFGGACPGIDKAQEWVVVHELFHTGNPWTRRKIPWFIEGFTTYYQDVLRARTGALTAAAAWGDLWDGFRRHCDPSDGSSLKDESDQLNSNYHYNRVYWGGACLAFFTDVTIRERSQGKQSLDDLMRELRVRSQRAQLDEDEILAALDQAAGGKQVSGWLRGQKPLPLRERLQRLGIEPTGDDTVRLHDDAPLAALRKAMF